MRVAKILGLVMATLVLVALGGLSLLGITPSYIMSAPAVATGIGAKLLCSARYVSGFSEEQSFDDLVQYSAILDRLTVESDESRVGLKLYWRLAELVLELVQRVGLPVEDRLVRQVE